ncbi:MAG: hypothetical protein ABI988_16020 [Nitrospirota bacterium]
MGLFSSLKRKTNSDPSDGLAALIIQVSVHECEQLASLWKRTYDDRIQVELFAEYATLLINIADQFAFARFGDPARAALMKKVHLIVREAFSRQRSIGATSEEAATYFDRLFVVRSGENAGCSIIMGGDTSVALHAAQHFVAHFNPDLRDETFSSTLFETGKLLLKSIAAIVTTPPFKAIGP